MNRLTTVLSVAALLLTLDMRSTPAQELWVGKDGNIRNVDTRAIVLDGQAKYLATRSEVYRSAGPDEKWESVFTVPMGSNEVTCLGTGAKNLFVGTKRGLFRSQDRGRTWKDVFRTMLPDKNNILSIDILKYYPGRVLIGTAKGVFISTDYGERWTDISGNIQNKRLGCVAFNKERIYAGGEDGLYLWKPANSGWERLYVNSAIEKSGAEEPIDDAEAGAEEEASRAVNCIALKGSRAYIGIDKKILYSEDPKNSWSAFPCEGLSGSLTHILCAAKSDRLYASTTKGVFEFSREKERWLELYKGMDKALYVTRLAFDGEDESSLWALTEKGLYKLESGRYLSDQYVDVEKGLKTFKITLDNEPSFRDLQQAALKFAELDPDKIRNWRSQARLKAFLPKVGVGWNNDRSTNSEIYTSATSKYVYVGPDHISDGIDFSVSWDLSNIMYSDDQTSIDVRSRLTTQLRNDVLDDLRRAYYERKRLQFELMTNPPKDIKGRFDKELRIQELGQAIDDLTGNYLSEHVKKVNSQ